MKSTYLQLFAAFALTASMASCSHVASDDRFIELPAVEAERVVLIEDFTGQNCTNCPEAHETIEGLEDQYGDNVVAVSIHAGPLSISDALPVGLATEEGNYYATQAGVEMYPTGRVNMLGNPTTPDEWPAKVYDEIQKPTPYKIDLDAVEDGGNITVKSSIYAGESAEMFYQLWIVENAIVAPQKYIDGDKKTQTNPKYVHNNVFRAAMNGLEGEAISLGSHEAQELECTYPCQEKWNKANLAVVAFLYTKKDGVLQAARVAVRPAN